MQKWLKYLIPVVVLIIMFRVDSSFAQCAMCKAAATSNLENETNRVGKGLNSGILYLMSVPYLLLFGMFYLFFKDSIKEKIKSIL